MADLTDTFGGFLVEDFDAYLPEKWNSNVYTLPRRKVKGKLEQLGAHLAEELEAQNLALVMHLSDEFPSLWNKKMVDTQWLFFSRDEAARAELSDIIDTERTLADTLVDPTPRYRHIFLGAAVNKDVLEIGLRLPYDAWVDRRNFLNLLKTDEAQKRFYERLTALPGHYEIGIADGTVSTLSDFEQDQVQTLADDFSNARGWLFVGARLPRDQALVLGPEVVDTAREVFRLLIPVYRFAAWSPDNDAISFDELVEKRQDELKASKELLDRQRAEREARLSEKEQQQLRIKQELEERVRTTEAWLKRETAIQRAQAARMANKAKEDDARARAEAMAAKWGLGKPETDRPDEQTVRNEPSQPREPLSRNDSEDRRRSAGLKPPRQAEKRPSRSERDLEKRSPEPPGELRVGERVKVLKGFLSGRLGIVQAIDEKGGVRVGFGSLVSRLSMDEVAAAGAGFRDRRDKSARKQPRG